MNNLFAGMKFHYLATGLEVELQTLKSSRLYHDEVHFDFPFDFYFWRTN